VMATWQSPGSRHPVSAFKRAQVPSSSISNWQLPIKPPEAALLGQWHLPPMRCLSCSRIDAEHADGHRRYLPRVIWVCAPGTLETQVATVQTAIALGLFVLLLRVLNKNASHLLVQVLPGQPSGVNLQTIMIIVNVIWRLAIKKMEPGWF